MGLLDLLNQTNDLASADGVVKELATRTKRGDIIWYPRGNDSTNATAGFRCHDENGAALEFHYADDARTSTDKRILVARDSDGSVMGTVSLGLAQYTRLVSVATKSIEDAVEQGDPSLHRHRGPFL